MLFHGLLVTGADGRYHPGIGDPTFLGWLTVVAYVFAAFATYRAWKVAEARERRADLPRERDDEATFARVFGLLTALLVVLGINKQLDLQTLFIQIVRDWALASGWYPERRRYQVEFIAAIATLGVVGTAFATYVLRRVARRIRGCIAGTALLVVFVVIRAASFHHVDVFLGGAGDLNPILELTGILLIAFCARRYAKPPRARR